MLYFYNQTKHQHGSSDLFSASCIGPSSLLAQLKHYYDEMRLLKRHFVYPPTLGQPSEKQFASEETHQGVNEVWHPRLRLGLSPYHC